MGGLEPRATPWDCPPQNIRGLKARPNREVFRVDLWPAIRACGRFPGRFPYGAGDWEGLLAAGVLRLVQGLVRPFRAEMNGGELRSWKVLAVGIR